MVLTNRHPMNNLNTQRAPVFIPAKTAKLINGFGLVVIDIGES